MTAHEQPAAPSLRSYEEARAWIEGLVPFGIRPGLERIRLLLEQLGHPERRLKFLHVAGTNGKGSVCAYLTEVLRTCGYDVGMYTSPYLTSFTNRFQYNGEDISEETLCALANRIKPLADEMAVTSLGSPTMFEVSTALAILYYGTVSYPDFVVWETGLGGRLDVTNIVSPLISIITNVGYDHMDVLGDTLEAIAREKAGIIKPGIPVVTAVSQPEVVQVMEETAASKRSSLYRLGVHFETHSNFSSESGQSFRFEGLFRSFGDLELSLVGDHQRENAAVAVMALEVLRQYYAVLVDEEELKRGLKQARWPGRLEMVKTAPRILLDGAHNPEGAAALVAALDKTYAFERLHVMIGMLQNKNHEATLRHILPLVNTLIVTEPDFRKKLAAEALAEQARTLAPPGVEIITESDWQQGLARLEQLTGASDLGVVTGTLYLISDVRARLLKLDKTEKGW